jgi:hypothetical protein
LFRKPVFLLYFLQDCACLRAKAFIENLARHLPDILFLNPSLPFSNNGPKGLEVVVGDSEGESGVPLEEMRGADRLPPWSRGWG